MNRGARRIGADVASMPVTVTRGGVNCTIASLVIIGVIALAALIIALIAALSDPATAATEQATNNPESLGEPLSTSKHNHYYACPESTPINVSICSLLCPSQDTGADCASPCPDNPIMENPNGGCYQTIPCSSVEKMANEMHFFASQSPTGVHHVEIAPEYPDCTARFYLDGTAYRHVQISALGTGFTVQALGDATGTIVVKGTTGAPSVCFTNNGVCV